MPKVILKPKSVQAMTCVELSALLGVKVLEKVEYGDGRVELSVDRAPATKELKTLQELAQMVEVAVA